jgi:hypothetical protein
MPEITTLADILDAHDHHLNYLSPKAVILYGSFANQNLNAPVKGYESLFGKQGLLDKKPDFIVVVPDIETTLKVLGEQHGWGKKNIEKILHMNRETPFYFNLKTDHAYDLELKNSEESVQLPYKIGVIGEREFRHIDDFDSYNIYLPARLSKVFRTVRQHVCFREVVKQKVENIRDFFVDLTLSLLPSKFSGEDFAKKYLKTTYLCEAYRVFDLVKKKHLKIFSSNIFEFESMHMVPMRLELSEILSDHIAKIPQVQRTDFAAGFYQTDFVNTAPVSLKAVYLALLRFNSSCLSATIKNISTNKICGSSNWDYLSRKMTS